MTADPRADALAVAVAALRQHAIVRTQRMVMVYGGGFEWTGFHCMNCKSDWRKREPESHKDDCVFSRIAAIEAAAPPSGWVLVPREPTTQMRLAGSKALLPPSIDFADEVWRKMIEEASK
jgi:hypothetical protein